MRTQDLMLGDWVGYIASWYDEDDPTKLVKGFETPIPIKATFITPDAIQFDEENPEDGSVVTCEALDYELHPIPLTIELLERIGFRRFHPSARLWEYGRRVYVDLNCPRNGRIMIGIGGNSHRLEYLHQLQHVFRLCGIRDEITYEQIYGKEENRIDAE